MNLPSSLAGVALLYVALACSGETTSPQVQPTTLIPLTVGTTFSYHSSDTLIGTAAAFEQPAPDSDFTVRVVSDIADRNGTRWAALDAAERAFGPVPGSSYFANTTDGLRRISNAFSGGSAVVTYVIFTYPARLGDLAQFGMTVGATDTVITVPAGTFHCVRYDSYSPVVGAVPASSVFIAPGTGVVKRSLNFSTERDRNGQLVGRHDRIYRLTALNTP